ncbi:hypothetical protein [Romboutsia lituseburensis]|uniref:hypothetical protein n=1 Tax=Romboutsia lituseburensis TaxID=1537 RepID=UPI0022EA345C|nr:hypothetical protein [Romboutsia lituseburensis]
MRENTTINRLIWEGKVYYRAKDLASQLFKCSMYKINKAIKNSDLELQKLDGISGKWIKEEDVTKIEIDNESKMMKTSYKDLQEEIKTRLGFASFFRQLHPNDPRPESMIIQDSIDKARDSVDRFTKANNKKDEEDNIVKKLNEIMEKQGFAERIHKVKVLLDTDDRDIKEFYALIDRNGQVLDVFNYIYNTSRYLVEECEKGIFDNYEYDENKIKLTKGIPAKVNEADIINTIVELAQKDTSIISQDMSDYIDINLENGKCVSLDVKLVSCVLFNKVTILRNSVEELLQETNYLEEEYEDEIIDVEVI